LPRSQTSPAFSAGELIGFSAALASVGTRPELSRGTFTRLFSEINQAVSGTSDSLDKFASLAGQSSQEFIDTWTAGEGASQIVEILRGLSVQGANAELSLRALGITSVRDVPTLLKLAQNVEEVEKTACGGDAWLHRGHGVARAIQYHFLNAVRKTCRAEE
jgi:hypothetical protein